ncbi:DnaA N-terminal domain-containing protein [Rhodoplanes roseus]|uniref:DnaA N-terminal domain-containing protein n=1 Tax=Rhodoplanes roseus TaxID=29409 RepID=UPI0011B7A5F8|nr:DnaA N-terminal domain-containing protein [Rhodoplanes roseus]
MANLLALIDDPVVQRLPPRAFRLLVNLMGLAGAGPLPDRGRLAWRLHLTESALARDLAPLVAAGRVEEVRDRVVLVEFASCSSPSAQEATATAVSPAPKSSTDAGSRERTRAWRARRRSAAATREAQPCLPLVSLVQGAVGPVVTDVTACDVTRDGVTAGDASPSPQGVTREPDQGLASVTESVTGVTPRRESLSFQTPEGRQQTQTLRREGVAVTGRDASPDPADARPTGIVPARAAYERFRALYPKPSGMDPRKPAEQEFLRLVLREGIVPERIVAAVAPFAEQVRRDRVEPRYVPASARWLRERRFEDIAESPAPAAAPTSSDPWLAPVIARLSREIGAGDAVAWFSRLAVVKRDPHRVTLAAPTRFVAETIEVRFADRLRAAVAAEHGVGGVGITVIG